MPDREVTEKLAAYRREIAALRDKIRALQNEAEPEEVENYRFATTEGAVRLSELFGDKEYLFVIHNMGKSCPACTMWADGFNGVLPHLENHAAFVVSSPGRVSKATPTRPSYPREVRCSFESRGSSPRAISRNEWLSTMTFLV